MIERKKSLVSSSRKPRDVNFWFGALGTLFGGAGIVIGIIALKPIIFPPPPDCDATVAAYTKLYGEHAALISSERQISGEIESEKRVLIEINKQKDLVVGFIDEQAVESEMRALAIMLIDAREHHLEVWGSDAFDINNGNRKPFYEDMHSRGWPKDPRKRRAMRLRFAEVSSFSADSFYPQFDGTPSNLDVIDAVIEELIRASNEPGPFSRRAWALGWSEERVSGGKGLREIANLDARISEQRQIILRLKATKATRISSVDAAKFQLTSIHASFGDRDCAGELPDH